MELPGFKMEWKIDWNITGSNYTGHNLFPSAAPLSDGKDTYSQFRSSSLDLKWTVDVKKSMKIFLFSTTLRQHFKNNTTVSISRFRGFFFKYCQKCLVLNILIFDQTFDF